ncbi:hypothetical protein AMECASPLE_009473 [Ameca splendens]|uniref:Uncharacterized protein n=1 Tax=Ameca splendens TaxID=208324 RepID=A0ABV0Y075_9TELE
MNCFVLMLPWATGDIVDENSLVTGRDIEQDQPQEEAAICLNRLGDERAGRGNKQAEKHQTLNNCEGKWLIAAII